MRKKLLAILIFLLGVSLLQATEYKYFARISYLEGNVMIERADQPGLEDATLNTPVGEGDRVVVAEGRTEIYLGYMTYIRLNHNSKVDLVLLPYEGSRGRIIVRLIYGEIFVRIGKRNVDFSLEFSGGEFNPIREGLYRIFIERGYKEFFVEEGFAELALGNESIDLGVNELVRVEGYRIYGPERVYSYKRDDFAAWNERRDERIWARSYSVRYLPPELSDYAWELDYYGSWRYVPPYGWVWVPRVPFYGWRPYYYGYWVWVPGGYFWVGYEPWGWVVYRYGRWGWSARIGWFWIPFPTWGYAWVSWTWWGDYIGWCPLDFYGRPLIIIDGFIYHYYDYIPLNSHTLIVIHKSQLTSRNIRRVALRKDQLMASGVRRARVFKSAPPLRPVYSLRKTKLGYKRVAVAVKPVAVSKTALGKAAVDRKSSRSYQSGLKTGSSKALSKDTATKSGTASSGKRKVYRKGSSVKEKSSGGLIKTPKASSSKKKAKKKKDQAYFEGNPYIRMGTSNTSASRRTASTYRKASVSRNTERKSYYYEYNSRKVSSRSSYYSSYYSRHSYDSYYPGKPYYSRQKSSYYKYKYEYGNSSKRSYKRSPSYYKGSYSRTPSRSYYGNSSKSRSFYSRPSYSGRSYASPTRSRSYSRPSYSKPSFTRRSSSPSISFRSNRSSSGGSAKPKKK